MGPKKRRSTVLTPERETFYRYKNVVESGGVEALMEKTRRKPNVANRVDEATEQAVLVALEFPAH